MKRLLFSLFLFPLILSAQINESDTIDLKASLALSGFWQGGNVETLIFRARSDISFVPFRKWVFKTQNSYVYQEFGQDKADEDILSLNFLYLNPERKLYPFALGFVSTNFRREIDLRYLLGAGVTYQILGHKDHWLKVSISSEYEKTDFTEANFNKPEYDGNAIINTIRGTIWVNGKYKLLDKKLVLGHESYFQPSLEQGNNFRWQADLSLEIPIKKFLNFRINYLHTYESVVIEDQKQQDQVMSFGFTLKNF